MLKIDTQMRLTLIKLEGLKKAAINNARRHLRKLRTGKNSRANYTLWLQLARGYGYQIHSLLNKKINGSDISKEAC